MTDKPNKSRRGRKAVTAALIMLALFMLVMLLSVCGCAQTITGKVVGVSDGDTITVLDASNKQHKIRLEGIDAPESNQDFGSRSKQSLSDLVFGKTVTVTSRKKDKYGHTLGEVTLDGKDISHEQVQRGMAWAYHYSANEVRPEEPTPDELAEAQARKEKRGLWADPSPTPPWDFRRGKTAKAPGVKPKAPATGPIIGNRNSKIYHLPNCPDYNKVSDRNRVPFKTESEAAAAGYRKARNCP
jgi:endonuclease YncB( thermonuclease family)